MPRTRRGRRSRACGRPGRPAPHRRGRRRRPHRGRTRRPCAGSWQESSAYRHFCHLRRRGRACTIRFRRPPTQKESPMQIAILVFEKLTALDAMGPYEVLSRLPGAELTFVGTETGEIRTDTGRLGITIDATLGEITE